MSKKKTDENIYYCIGCNQAHPKGNFYTSFNPIHQSGRYPFCKKYIKADVYINEEDIDLSRFKNLLRQMDAPFLQNIWESSLEGTMETIGAYFSNINMVQYRGMTWTHGDIADEAEDKTENSEIEDEDQAYFDDSFKPTIEMVRRWGKNYPPIKIYYLEQFYQDMHTTHTIVTPQHEKALILICKLQLKMDDALENDDMVAFAKAHSEYQKLLTSSGLRPIDKVGGAEASGIRSFSQVFEEIEKGGFIKPAPIEENQDIVDKTIQYIMNYTLKLLNQQVLTEPPFDTPKVDDNDD